MCPFKDSWAFFFRSSSKARVRVKYLGRPLGHFILSRIGLKVNPIKLETGLRPNGAGITFTVLLRNEAIGFPTFGLLL